MHRDLGVVAPNPAGCDFQAHAVGRYGHVTIRRRPRRRGSCAGEGGCRRCGMQNGFHGWPQGGMHRA